MAKLSRTDRLRKQELRLSQSLTIKNKYFLALFKPNQQKHARLGIIVSKQFVRRAVDRNLLKRVVRESFRYHKEDLKELDIVVIIRSECSIFGAKIWRNDIDNLWQKLIASLKIA